jgi:hypothetical protein
MQEEIEHMQTWTCSALTGFEAMTFFAGGDAWKERVERIKAFGIAFLNMTRAAPMEATTTTQ